MDPGDTTQWFQYFEEQITSRKGPSLDDLFDNADQWKWQQEKKSIIQSGQSGSVGRARQGIMHQGDGRLTSEFVSLDLSTRYYKIFQDFSINCEDICWETHANWGGWIRIDRVNTPTLLIGNLDTDDFYETNLTNNKTWTHHPPHPGECYRSIGNCARKLTTPWNWPVHGRSDDSQHSTCSPIQIQNPTSIWSVLTLQSEWTLLLKGFFCKMKVLRQPFAPEDSQPGPRHHPDLKCSDELINCNKIGH